MAPQTPDSYRCLVFYQVFPRNFGPTGKLRDVTAQVGRIRSLGVDVLYLMPIHPIGEVGRKGTQGSPYAISDYRTLNPELGTDEDFDELVRNAHEAGLKVIIDVVFNHTSPDAVLLDHDGSFYHQDAQGQPFSTVPAWTDIIDLKHPNPDLAKYLIESLAIWVRRGVDGFRCDVASLVPVDFWIAARSELSRINPELIWLAESPHPKWVADRRRMDLPTWSDAEMFAAFDILYDYDMWSIWQAVVSGREPLRRYVEMLRWQEASLPGNAAKLRFVENHDQFRIMRFAPSADQALAWTAFAAFNRGPFMIYAGQEAGARKWPSLFEPDPVDWGTRELEPFLRACATIKKHPAVALGKFWIISDDPALVAVWGVPRTDNSGEQIVEAGLLGIFDVQAAGGEISVDLPDGSYPNLLGGSDVTVVDRRACMPGAASVVEFNAPLRPRPVASDLLDLFLHVEEMGDE